MNRRSIYIYDISNLRVKLGKICAEVKSDDSSINRQDRLEICNVSIEILPYS